MFARILATPLSCALVASRCCCFSGNEHKRFLLTSYWLLSSCKVFETYLYNMNRDWTCMKVSFRVTRTHYLAVTTKIQGLRNKFHYITWMIVNFNSLTLTKENWLTLLLQISGTNDDSFELARSVYLQNLCLLSFWNKIILSGLLLTH